MRFLQQFLALQYEICPTVFSLQYEIFQFLALQYEILQFLVL